MVQWKRPENVPFPSVWRTFEGKPDANGVKRKYWVQDLTDEYKEAFFHHMTTGFLNHEILNKYAHATEDPATVKDYVNLWTHLLDQRLALICLTKNDKDENQIVGFNATGLSHKDEKLEDFKFNGKEFHRILHLMLYLSHLRNVFTELDVQEYLTAVGLYVLPEFRGEGIGSEILKARRELCLAVGIKVSATVFTSIISQKSAAKAGFKDLTEVAYEDLEKINPDEFIFPGITSFTKSIKYMYIKYD